MDLNIKVIWSNIHTSVYDKRDEFGFPIVNFPSLSGDVPRLPSYGIYISQLVRFARWCTSVFYFHSKNLQITSKLLTQGYRYHKLRKTFGKFFKSYSELLSKFGAISFQDYVSQGITHLVFYGDLVYKLRRVKGEANFISSGSKIVKRLRRRQYDPAIIERTIGLVLGPFTALYRSFLKRCTPTNKAVGTISKHPRIENLQKQCLCYFLIAYTSLWRNHFNHIRILHTPILGKRTMTPSCDIGLFWLIKAACPNICKKSVFVILLCPLLPCGGTISTIFGCFTLLYVQRGQWHHPVSSNFLLEEHVIVVTCTHDIRIRHIQICALTTLGHNYQSNMCTHDIREFNSQYLGPSQLIRVLMSQ